MGTLVLRTARCLQASCLCLEGHGCVELLQHALHVRCGGHGPGALVALHGQGVGAALQSEPAAAHALTPLSKKKRKKSMSDKNETCFGTYSKAEIMLQAFKVNCAYLSAVGVAANPVLLTGGGVDAPAGNHYDVVGVVDLAHVALLAGDDSAAAMIKMERQTVTTMQPSCQRPKKSKRVTDS